uniref:Methylmalonyl-CoA mutase C-terminal domain-containing protein n=1 Tax=Candidatus Kentrum eta TaxID=2126337 RepID=A0A450V3Q0_9GAMM|nr:MAG: methylmalonyl-CoA mutase C-terminal domain-containing protein [Candidatus Kentron sp. H]VFJ99731.1 MAG: methylmalonyl-CoA mutase C-terminal domain-containing protein [Candidatus Kentron sp. H]VFK04010.1 MAG: methylmalonyl-CoA mutase C-terminal domain-containing protein [Candidatus Kentron sp. H]
MSELFEEEREGRRPRIMVAWIGQDGHDRGGQGSGHRLCGPWLRWADIGALFQTPGEVARQAVENDAHVVGMSTKDSGHATLLPELVKELKGLDREDIMVVVGGVIPAQNYDYLYEHGASAIFGPGTVIPVAARKVIAELDRRHG